MLLLQIVGLGVLVHLAFALRLGANIGVCLAVPVVPVLGTSWAAFGDDDPLTWRPPWTPERPRGAENPGCPPGRTIYVR